MIRQDDEVSSIAQLRDDILLPHDTLRISGLAADFHELLTFCRPGIYTSMSPAIYARALMRFR